MVVLGFPSRECEWTLIRSFQNLKKNAIKKQKYDLISFLENSSPLDREESGTLNPDLRKIPFLRQFWHNSWYFFKFYKAGGVAKHDDRKIINFAKIY